MISKAQAIQNVREYILELKDDTKIDKCKDIIKKINSISEEKFSKIVHNTLGENANIEDFKNWLVSKLKERDLHETEFTQLNEMVSYNIAGTNQNTVVLHVAPKHVTMEQIRNGGSYLVDALEQIKMKLQNGEIENIETVFAVSDILKLKSLQKDFKGLGFGITQGEERFRRRFKNPYQASLDTKTLLSDEWEEKKKKFMNGRPTITELRKENAEAGGEDR